MYSTYRQPSSHAPSSPISSVNLTPSSSPVFGPVDSSPPSSPGLVPYSLADSPPPSAPFSHPFAASTKANKRLPSYEKKPDTPPCTPPGTFTLRSAFPASLTRGAPASRSLQEHDCLGYAVYSPGASPPSHRTFKYVDREERIWEDALRTPIDTGIGQIDLSNQKLKSIPASIGDLSRFFNTTESSEQSLISISSMTTTAAARVPARVNTEPEPVRSRSFERTQSIKDSGKERHVLKLYLMGNMISSLPPELFTLRNLTVLSLRANKLTHIPPEICLLTNLHELNISNNQLRFLPWQMLDMKIEKLLLNPNPFLPEPSSPQVLEDHTHGLDRSPLTLSPRRAQQLVRTRRSITRLHSLRKEALSATKSKPTLSSVTLTPGLVRVPPLTELCLRLLLAPSLSTACPSLEAPKAQSTIVEHYGLPLSDQWTIPPGIRRILVDAVPGIIRSRKRQFTLDAMSWSGSPERAGKGSEIGTRTRTRTESGSGSGMTGTGMCPNPAHKGRALFVKHASERFSWERTVAGVDVGGAVPIRWRGCLGTCLDFLDGQGTSAEEDGKKDIGGVINEKNVSVYDLGANVDVDIDVSMAVREVDLGSVVGLDMEDFDFDDE